MKTEEHVTKWSRILVYVVRNTCVYVVTYVVTDREKRKNMNNCLNICFFIDTLPCIDLAFDPFRAFPFLVDPFRVVGRDSKIENYFSF